MGISGSVGVNPQFLPGPQDKSAFGELLIQPLTPQVIVHFPYNLNTDIVNTSTTGSGAVTHSGQFVQIASGAATSSSGTLFTNKFLEYHPGIGALVRFTAIWGTGITGNIQIAGPGNATDGFFFGYNETSFGVMRRSASSDTWIPQSTWNVDKYDGTGKSGNTLDTSKGNVFQIKFQWLGFGAISFYIENQITGELDLVHQISYTNQNTETSIENPSLPFCATSINTTNNTDIVIKISSIGMFVEGILNDASHTIHAIDNTKTISTELSILTIRNKSTYQGISNAVQIQPTYLSLAADGTKNVTIHAHINTTLGGTPSYTDIDADTSVVDYDIAGTTITGGRLVFIAELSKTGDKFINLRDLNMILSPGDTLTFDATSSSSNDVSIGVMWQERFS